MKKIYVSRMTIISLLIFLLSIGGIVISILRINLYNQAQPLAYFSKDSLKAGRYVTGTITSYVVNKRRPTSSDVDYSIYTFGNWDNLIDTYAGYIIPFDDGNYIRIWINDEESLALLNGSQDGFHVNVSFVGKIKVEDTPADYADDVLGFDHNKVITDYAIVQQDLKAEKYWIIVCLFGIVTALILYFFEGKVEVSEE
ncbi:MAG: hypothetical protein NC313_08390 [Butyrivibrio sp.]|nr:hypothetical protein [Butyrivibrio sp.]